MKRHRQDAHHEFEKCCVVMVVKNWSWHYVSGFSRTHGRQRPAMLWHRTMQACKLTTRASAPKTSRTNRLQSRREPRTSRGGGIIQRTCYKPLRLAQLMSLPGFLERHALKRSLETTRHFARQLQEGSVSAYSHRTTLLIVVHLELDLALLVFG